MYVARVGLTSSASLIFRDCMRFFVTSDAARAVASKRDALWLMRGEVANTWIQASARRPCAAVSRRGDKQPRAADRATGSQAWPTPRRGGRGTAPPLS